MNKQIIILLLTLVLLNGCSSKSSDNSIVFENTVASMKKNIVGTWQSSCIDTKDGYSKITTKIFDSNNTYISSISTFSGAECKFYEFNSTAKLKYTIGGLINNNIEIDFERYDEITYTLVHFKDNQLYIANNISAEGVRKSDFTNSEALSKVADIVIDVEDEKPPVKYENTVESMKENIVGTWKSDCIDTEDEYSKIATKIFDSNNTYISSITTFSGAECEFYEFNSTATSKYTIGGVDNDNIEIDFEIEGEITYTLVHFIDNQLYIANDINDTAEGVRETDFSKSEALTKIE